MTRYWTINGRFLSQPVTGVQRYAREIVVALDQLMAQSHPLTRDLEIEIVGPPGMAQDLALEKIGQRVAGRGSGYVWEQVELPRHTRGGLLSLCNVGPLVAKRHVLCIHDVNTFLAPESYSWKFRALYRYLLPALGSMVSRVATVSRFSADQLARFGIAPESKITVIPNGHEHAMRWGDRHSEKTRAVGGDNTIVVIGSPAPHKNVAMILGLAQDLAAHGLRFAVVGSLDAKVFNSSQVDSAAGNVYWLGRLTDGEIGALLNDCLCLAFPSLTEGFGLPALEAMAVGCPIVVSDRASLPEICADAALYASPNDPKRWLAHFLELKKNSGLRDELRQRGGEAATRYSWSKSAALYLEVLAAIDSVRQAAPGSSPVLRGGAASGVRGAA